MKIIVKILFILCLINGNAYSANKNVGRGEVIISDAVVYHFVEYVKGGYGKKPGTFWITIDGQDPYYWYCGEGSCQSGGQELAACETFYNKECKLFARRRTIKWENGINPGKGKESTIKSKWNEAEIKEKLIELGFLK